MSSETETPVPDYEAARKWAEILHNHPDRIATPKHANLADAYLVLTAERDRLREDLRIEQLAYKGCDARAAEAEAKLASVRAILKDGIGVVTQLASIREGACYRVASGAWLDCAHSALAPERAVAADFDPCAPCCEPASPLLPGLERAAEIVHQFLDTEYPLTRLPLQTALRKTIDAEISRLKGEGSEP